jgi:glycosyltransferase involved in cell wall biosynthesis
MRVLVWQELFWPCIGGIEVLATRLFATLRQRGWEVVAVTRQDSPDLPARSDYGDISVRRYPFPWNAFANGNIDQLLQIRHQIACLMREFNPDLVHLNSFGPSFFFYHNIPRARSAPLVVTLHTTPRSVIPGTSLTPEGLFRKTLHQAAWVTCVSEAVLRQARQIAPEISSHSSVVYNGFDIQDAPAPLPFDPPCLLCVGRLIPEKRFDLAIAALASIRETFPRVCLIIAGDGPERRALQEQVTREKLSESVEFLGWVPPAQVSKLLNRTTAVLMPSHREGLPSVAIEAALMARPIVATQVGGLPEVVIHKTTGLLVSEGDREQLVRAILFLLHNPCIAETFGDAARVRAQELFSFRRYVDSYEDLYRKMISAN